MKIINRFEILLLKRPGLIMLTLFSLSFARAQQISNGYISVNGQYLNYSGDVNNSYYPVMSVQSEHGGGPKSVLSVGFGGGRFDMFTKISSWSRTPTKNNIDSTNYIAIGQTGYSYTPGHFSTGGKIGVGTLDPRDMLDVWGGGIHVTGTDHNGTAVITSNQGTVFYGNNNYLNGLAILPGGDIGIGTASPKEKLSVNGKIRAHEIKVETQNWPDYVFADEYKIPSLKELGNYIKTNKHLPEIPTAADMEKSGIALGEMNKILVKKIEELTLYLIGQDETIQKKDLQIKMQSEQIKLQGERLDSIEQKLQHLF